MSLRLGLIMTALFIGACTQKTPEVETRKAAKKADWIDTVRFNTELSDAEWQQVFYKRNYAEDYQLLRDTARIALHLFWWRTFDPYVIVRLENRPQYRISANLSQKYEEWFATYKEDVQRLNHDCPVEQNDRCIGTVARFVHRQGVEILPLNQTPALLAALDSVGFWKMKAAYLAGPHTDGSNWTLQVYYKSRYKEVSTNLAQHPIKSTCRRIIKLSRYPVQKDRIY